MPAVAPLASDSPGELDGDLPGDQPELNSALSADLTELNGARSLEQMEMNRATSTNRSDLGHTRFTDWSRKDGAPSADQSCPVGCSPERALLWLLRLTGQADGFSCAVQLYAVLLYVVTTGVDIFIVVLLGRLGVQALSSGQKFLEAAFRSYFFGALSAISWVPLTCTAVCGRSRYTRLLSDVQTLLKEEAQVMGERTTDKRLRTTTHLLVAAAAVLVSSYVLLFLQAKEYVIDLCTFHAPMSCLFSIMYYLSLGLIFVSLYMIPIKFLYITMLLSGGFEAVDAELRALARDGKLKDWTRLAQLRGLQDRLSTTFSRLVTDMTPELIPVTICGVAFLISTFLALLFASQNYSDMLQTMLSAVLMIAVPCEAGQRVLDLVTATRGSLLRLRWETPRVGQEVSMFQETVRRDLEHLGDLGYYRLQRSTMVSITSTVITYTVIFVQFRMSGI